ncbi:MAG: hypothetical protein N4A33_04835, partial [Bacteriovoracaceae bacterium]|nr:hypothetical protein [Bacteriovoracaceae bacterium]
MAKHKFNDFSGGLTDLPFNTASNYATNCDNFLIGRDKSIEVRQGFNFLDSNNPQLSTERINNIIEIDDDLVYISNGSGYFINGTVQQVSTPTSNPIFHQATPDTMSSIAQIGEQFIAVDDSYSFPMKLFRDETNTLKAITAGLPPILTDPVFSTTASNKNYVYAICYAYEYQVGT